MNRKATTWIAVAAGAVAVGALAVATPAIAGAASGVAGSVRAANATPTDDQAGRGGGQGETPLTGETKDKVEEAALAKVPGATVIRVETDAGGTYEAHLRKTDGTEVEVKVDKNFTVTAVNEFNGRGPGGMGRPGGNETPLTGEAKTKAEAAALAKVPGGTVVRSETDADGTYEVHVRKSDGTEVVVKLDKNFAVTGVDAFTGRGPGGPGGHDGNGPDGQNGQGGTASPGTTQGSSFNA